MMYPVMKDVNSVHVRLLNLPDMSVKNTYMHAVLGISWLLSVTMQRRLSIGQRYWHVTEFTFPLSAQR